MKNNKIITSWNKIEPSDAANERMLSAILERNRSVQKRNRKENNMSHKTRKRFIPAAACLVALIAAAFIIPPGVTGKSNGSTPFVITAYSEGRANDLIISEDAEKIAVPISLFKTESGIEGFVFSYEKSDKNDASTFSVFNNDKTVSAVPRLDEISDLVIDNGKHYIFYIPDKSEAAPYNITIKGIDQGTEYAIVICVEANGSEYEASISGITTYPVLDSSIMVNENGQTYGKDASYNDCGTEPDLIYAEALDGTAGYVYASDLNADRPASPEDILNANAKNKEIWDNAPAGEVVVARYIPLYEADGKTVIGEFPITIGFKEKADSPYPGQ